MTRERVRIALANGRVYDIEVSDGILPEDILIQGAQAAGYQLITGEDRFFIPDRGVRDFLVRVGMYGE